MMADTRSASQPVHNPVLCWCSAHAGNPTTLNTMRTFPGWHRLELHNNTQGYKDRTIRPLVHCTPLSFSLLVWNPADQTLIFQWPNVGVDRKKKKLITASLHSIISISGDVEPLGKQMSTSGASECSVLTLHWEEWMSSMSDWSLKNIKLLRMIHIALNNNVEPNIGLY